MNNTIDIVTEMDLPNTEEKNQTHGIKKYKSTKGKKPAILELQTEETALTETLCEIPVKQSKGLKRNTIDKYYTKDTTVKLCIEFITQYISINPDDLIIEPSAGNGSFIESIKGITSNYLFYDLEPENEEIEKLDYLDYDETIIQSTYKYIHIIGNPPFGRQSSLAIKFIKKSCKFGDSISFILPKSFKKDSLKKTFPLNFHLMLETDLPNWSFLVDGIEHDVPCIFQIWKKMECNRDVFPKLEPSGFVFIDKMEDPDISFRRVGVNAGKIDTYITDKSIQSHYFIKFTNNKLLSNNVKNISTIKYSFNNTVGPKSISKQELIKEFIKVL